MKVEMCTFRASAISMMTSVLYSRTNPTFGASGSGQRGNLALMCALESSGVLASFFDSAVNIVQDASLDDGDMHAAVMSIRANEEPAHATEENQTDEMLPIVVSLFPIVVNFFDAFIASLSDFSSMLTQHIPPERQSVRS